MLPGLGQFIQKFKCANGLSAVKKLNGKRIASLVLVFLFLASVYAPVMAEGGSNGYPVRLVDDAGNVITIYQQPTRIISLAPSNTILAYGLGLGKYLVGGVGNQYVCATIAPMVVNLTSVGGFSGLDYDEILSLKPQLVLASGINSPQQIAKLEQMNLTVMVLNPQNITGVERDIMLLGNATGTQQKAEEIVAWMKDVISDVQARLPSNKTKTFYLLDTYGGYWTAGNSTFINSMIQLAGGYNIASNITGYGTFSPEAILVGDPQVLVLDQYANSSVVNQMPFQGVSAVKDGRVYVIPHEGWFAQPTYRLVYGIVWLAEALHPSAMGGFAIPPCPASTGSENVTPPVSIVAPQIARVELLAFPSNAVLEGRPVTISAEAISYTGSPMAGQKIEFLINGTTVGYNVTASDGIATFEYVPSRTGQLSVEAASAANPSISSTNTLRVGSPVDYLLYTAIALIVVIAIGALVYLMKRQGGKRKHTGVGTPSKSSGSGVGPGGGSQGGGGEARSGGSSCIAQSGRPALCFWC